MTTIGPGTELCDGRYVIERLLGSGGMASVWKARDNRLHRDVAVKVIADTLAADPRYLQRFEREARTAAGLSHPNLVRIYDFNADGARPFLIMEYLPGGTLADRLKEDRLEGLDPEQVARDILAALAQVHEAGIVHRDVKPANVIVDEAGRARLTDFGIARAEDATSLTKTGMVVGTHRYLAPETMAGAPATPSTDLYACGVLLDEVTSKLPSAPVAVLATQLTRRDPAARPGSAQEALEQLDARAPAVPVAAPTAFDPRDIKVGRRTLVAVAVVGLLALVLTLSFVLGGDDSPSPPREAAPAEGVPERLDALEEAIRAAGR